MLIRTAVAAVVLLLPCEVSAQVQEPQPILPTLAEAEEQLRDNAAVDESAKELERTREELAALMYRIQQLEQTNQGASDEIGLLRHELERKEREEVDRVVRLRTSALPRWAGSVTGLNAGLKAAQGIGTLTTSVLPFRSGSRPWWHHGLNGLGGALSVLGLGQKAFGNTDQEQTQGVERAVIGIGVYLVGELFKSQLDPKGADTLESYVQRITLQQVLASDILALNEGVSEVINALKPALELANELRDLDLETRSGQCQLRVISVTNETVMHYRSAVDAYERLTTQLALANRAARRLQGQPQWTTAVNNDLARIIDNTDAAIAAWRQEAIRARLATTNLDRIARADPIPPGDDCGT